MTRTKKTTDLRIINVTSGFGANTGEPFVALKIPNHKVFQLRAEEARNLGLNLLQAAEAAEVDGFLMSFGRNYLKLETAPAALLLRAYRRHRDEQRELNEKQEAAGDGHV